MSGKAARRRAYKRLVARAIGKEYERQAKTWVPKQVYYCSVCHGRLRLVLLPNFECRKCGRTYDMSEPPLPPEVTDGTEMALPVMQQVGDRGSEPQVQGMQG